MPNKILLSGKKGSGKSTLAYHVINYVLSKLEVDKYDLEKYSLDTVKGFRKDALKSNYKI